MAPQGGKSPQARIFQYVRDHPGDVVATIVVAVVAIITLLDLFGSIRLSTETLARAAVFAVSTFIVVQLAEQARNQSISERRGQELAKLLENQKKVDQNLSEILRISKMRLDEQVSELTVQQREEQLQNLLGNTTSWHFRGGSGRWQRSTVLPALSKITNTEITYVMQVVDLRDRDLCKRYADYRAKQRPARVGNPGPPDGTLEDVRADLLACVYAAAWYSAKTRIQAEISLMSTYSPLRYDAGSHGLVVTVADPNAPALLAHERGWFYAALLDDIRKAHYELPRIVFPAGTTASFPAFESVTAKEVREVLLATTVKAVDGKSTPLISEADSIDFDDIASRSFRGRGE